MVIEYKNTSYVFLFGRFWNPVPKSSYPDMFFVVSSVPYMPGRDFKPQEERTRLLLLLSMGWNLLSEDTVWGGLFGPLERSFEQHKRQEKF
jgi:hypothetical protein